MELRTIQDWIVKRQLSGIPGIVEINSFGGYLKQYEVAIDPDALAALQITIGDVFEALSKNNQNTGGSYINAMADGGLTFQLERNPCSCDGADGAFRLRPEFWSPAGNYFRTSGCHHVY